jgi:hypothetical protein
MSPFPFKIIESGQDALQKSVQSMTHPAFQDAVFFCLVHFKLFFQQTMQFIALSVVCFSATLTLAIYTRNIDYITMITKKRHFPHI